MANLKRGWIIAACWLVAAGAVAMSAAAAAPPPRDDSRIPLSERKRIAVLPFEDGAIIESSYFGRVFNVGRGVADMLTTALVETRKFRVIERDRVNSILAEQDLGQSGRLDPATAARVGKIVGADYLVLGRVTRFGVESGAGAFATRRGDIRRLSLSRSVARVTLDGRLVDSTTGEIIFAFTGDGRDSRIGVGVGIEDIGRFAFGSIEFGRTILGAATREAVGHSVARIATAAEQMIYQPPDLSAVKGYVVYIDGPMVMTNLGARYGVRTGDRFQVVRRGQEVRDPETGETLTVIIAPVGVLRVDDVEEKVSSGTMVERAGEMQVQVGDQVQFGDMVKPLGG